MGLVATRACRRLGVEEPKIGGLVDALEAQDTSSALSIAAIGAHKVVARQAPPPLLC